jgi:hypothetical protein
LELIYNSDLSNDLHQSLLVKIEPILMGEMNLTASHRFGQTFRKDAWWTRPLIIFICLTAFVIYVTWAAFQGEHYFYGPYISPLYSPKFLEIHLIAGLVRSPAGGPEHCHGRQHYSYCGAWSISFNLLLLSRCLL